MSNYYSVVQYTNAGGETDFTVTFPFLRRDHVFVYIGDALQPDWTYEWIDQQTIRLAEPLDFGVALTFRRFTFKDARLAEYTDGSILTALELNEVTLQLLYIIQEMWDFRKIGEDNDVTVPGDPEDAKVPQALLDEIIAALEETPIFQTLTSLIPLVDLNAESVIQNALLQHENWKLDGFREELRKQFQVETGANIVNLQNTIETETTALASTLSAVTARVDDNEAGLVAFQSAYADDESARAIQFNDIFTSLEFAESSIASLQLSETTQDASIASLTTELASKLTTDDLDAELATSSVISGIETSVSNVEGQLVSETARIDSSLATVNDNLSVVQTTANTAVTRTDALADTVFTLGSIVSGDPDAIDPVFLASAIETQFNTYADLQAETAKAEAISTLQAQTKPIFYSPGQFGDSPPSADINDPGYREGYPTGFPDGAVWVRTFSFGGDPSADPPVPGLATTFTYIWERGNTSLANTLGIDVTNPEPYIYVKTTGDANFRGRWINSEVGVIGALAQQMSDVNIGPEHAASLLRNQVQSQLDTTVGAVETQLTSRINQVENTVETVDGEVTELVTNVDLQYSLRMNLTRGNAEPIVAGYGLGLSGSDTAGFRSDFVVMADNFSVIKPPTNGDYENGSLVGFSTVAPFVVDSASGSVIINGDLFISDTLHAYSGRIREVVAGKITLGQLSGDPQVIDPNWNSLVDPNGYRLELNSSTNGYWTGPNRNYLMWAGTGDRNDNNGTFWLDSAGNAFFGGNVLAAGITGSLMDAVPIDYVSPTVTTAPSGGGWVTVGNAIIQANATTARARRPFAIVTINMFGVNAQGGEARLEMRTGSNGNFGSWVGVAQHTNDMTSYGSALTLSGGLGYSTTGDVQLRVLIREWNGQFPQSNGYSGIIMAFPVGTSGTVLQDNPSGPSAGGSGSVPSTPDPAPTEPEIIP